MTKMNRFDSVEWCSALHGWKTVVSLLNERVTVLIHCDPTAGDQGIQFASRLIQYLVDNELTLRQTASQDVYETDVGYLYGDDGQQLDQTGVFAAMRLETIAVVFGQCDLNGSIGWTSELYYDLGGVLLDHQVVVYLNDCFEVLAIGRA